MISICIPVYNFPIVPLVEKLLYQADQGNIDIEIVLIDDFSIPTFEQQNRNIPNDKRVHYLPLIENIGRSKIRNRLADYSKGEWLLFMDCDMAPKDDEFLARYLKHTHEAVDVVCGGVTAEKPKENDFQLQWLVDNFQKNHFEKLKRNNIFVPVSTGNFMIRRSMYEQVRFNENLKGYGREDQLFSLNLRDRNARIAWIENPTVHQGLEKNEDFLKKLEESQINLVCVWNSNREYQPTLKKVSSRLAIATTLQRLGLSFIISLPYYLLQGRMRRSAIRGKCSILCLSFYQMGFLLKALRVPNLSEWSKPGKRRAFVRDRVKCMDYAINQRKL